jgi:hypothetical protein
VLLLPSYLCHPFSRASGASEGNLFYSFEYGPVHFITLSSEAVFFWHSLNQYQWLQNDLAKVNRYASDAIRSNSFVFNFLLCFPLWSLILLLLLLLLLLFFASISTHM